ncbi:hypothetical protein shim_21180 [Shimia sp. SK013]|uniref:DUF4238 domain-containing protein n=1 Tax=Shimia sp. SK013 TaxID=1389006 RepID=UPI0006B6892E|nr:DUF4238 domain-containing protein [Shimia sp. SK013]KPA21414.1 hypothetical protein shim_21180 [Shimia sp. SK013]
MANTSKPPKKHHYVPQAILSYFCFKGASLHYVDRDKLDKGIQQRNKESVFRRIHYNSFEEPDGNKNASLETFFAEELDNYIPEWVRLFESATKTGRLDFGGNQSRDRFVQFFFNHRKRTPEFLDPIVEKVAKEAFDEKTLVDLEDKFRPLTEEERQLVRSDQFQNKALRNARVENLSKQAEPILGRLASMKIVIASPTRLTKNFVVASNPVARFEDYPWEQLGSSGVELWTTMTPRIAVGFVAKSRIPDVILLDDSTVRKMNMTLTKQSRAIAATSAPLLRSIAKSAW